MWESGGYPPKFQARIVAWHRAKAMIDSHRHDAVAKDMKRRQRKKGKK